MSSAVLCITMSASQRGADVRGGLPCSLRVPTRALAAQGAAQVQPEHTKASCIRLSTANLRLERKQLGPVPRSYDGINALAVLMSERHPDAVR